MDKRLNAVAALVVLAVVAAACSNGSSEPERIQVGGPYDTVEISPFEPSVDVTGEPGEVVEQDCPERMAEAGLRCVWVIVPIDRADPAAGNTGISVAIRHGTGDESLPPLAVLQGGPGGSSSNLAFALASRPYTQVLIDQRGVGFGSANFWCREWQVALKQILEATRDRADEVASAAFARCSDRFKHEPVFAHTSTEAHAADVVDVMAALGYEQWLLYGVSYGTTIALEVLRDDPAGLAGAVLDGVYPGNLDLDAAMAAGAERVVREFDEECSVDPVCSGILAGTTGREGVTMAGLLAELIPRFNADPVVVPFATEETTLLEPFDALLDGDSVAGVVFRMLYNEFSATAIPGVLAGLAREDGANTGDQGGPPSATKIVALVGVETASQQAHTGAPATSAAVTCAEWLPLASGPPPGIGPFGAAVVGEGLSARCEPWAVAASPLPTEPVQSDLPVLLISGRFDPITHPSFAEAAVEYLPRGTHVVTRTRGHGIWVWGYDNCVDRIVADFLAEPGAELDVACALEDRPLRWQPLP
ncbi:MAG: alpha/beta hydrolase [Acidimicrobiaceae bacterium]|nr:alpha/beta hydrolase [Acidimicrobiaceae bacterium]MYH92211.1 alpha/beta hydrolase [Acidimicrobiaceae bacterium]MYI35045.1 alpha/beta hydrolase [Acidimicrobiaceae bacterium]